MPHLVGFVCETQTVCARACRARPCDGVAYMPPGLTHATADVGISHSCVTSSQTAASQGVVGTTVAAGGGKSPRKRGWGWGG